LRWISTIEDESDWRTRRKHVSSRKPIPRRPLVARRSMPEQAWAPSVLLSPNSPSTVPVVL
jgi:hypothetical protein